MDQRGSVYELKGTNGWGALINLRKTVKFLLSYLRKNILSFQYGVHDINRLVIITNVFYELPTN